MKCIEDEIPFDVPEGWEWTRIFSISNELPYGTAKKSDSSGKVIVLRMGNLQNGEVDYSDLVYSSDASDIEKYNLIQGDLLFNRTNSSEWVGKTSIYRGDFPAIYAGYIIRLRTPLNSEFLNAVMNSSYAYQYCRMVKTDGVNQSNINAQKLGAFLVPVAPTEEQQMIAHKIYDILPQIDSIAKCKKSVEEITSYIKEKVLDLAIHGRLVKQNSDDEPASALLERIRAEKEDLIKQGKLKHDKKESIIYKGDDNSYYELIGNSTKCIDDEIPFEVPDGWSWARGKTIFVPMESRKPTEETFDYIDIDSIDNKNNVVTEPKHLFSSKAPSRASRAVFNGSVVFSTVRPYLKNIAYIDEKLENCIASTGFYICTSNGTLYPQYMFLMMISHYVVDGLNQYMKGDNSPSINKDDIDNWLFPIPPYNEQIRIQEKVHTCLNNITEIGTNLL